VEGTQALCTVIEGSGVGFWEETEALTETRHLRKLTTGRGLLADEDGLKHLN